MKKILLILLTLLLASGASGQPTEPLIYTLIAKRCERYLPKQSVQECQETVARMLSILDYDLSSALQESETHLNKRFLFVAFKNDLIELLSLPETTRFLEDLNHQLNNYLLGTQKDFNLWDLARSHYPTDFRASRMMAVLFQDTSSSELHLKYLEKTREAGRLNFKLNKDLLKKSIEAINLLLDYSPHNFQELFYPRSFTGPFNQNIYHFYVPFYLSLALQKNNVNKKMSRVAPLLMTLTYEFMTASEDLRYLIFDPKILDPVIHSWKLKDIYASYCAVSMASVKDPILQLSELNQLFSVSTYESVLKLLE